MESLPSQLANLDRGQAGELLQQAIAASRCTQCQKFRTVVRSSTIDTIGENLRSFLNNSPDGRSMKNPQTGLLDSCSGQSCYAPCFVTIIELSCGMLVRSEHSRSNQRRFLQEALKSGTLEVNKSKRLGVLFASLEGLSLTDPSQAKDTLEDLVTTGYDLKSNFQFERERKNLLGFLLRPDPGRVIQVTPLKEIIQKIHQLDPTLINSPASSHESSRNGVVHLTPLALCLVSYAEEVHLELIQLLLELGADPSFAQENEGGGYTFISLLLDGPRDSLRQLGGSLLKEKRIISDLLFSKTMEQWKGKEGDYLQFMRAQWRPDRLAVSDGHIAISLGLPPDSNGDFRQRWHASWPYVVCADQDFPCPSLIYFFGLSRPTLSQRLNLDLHPLLSPFKKKWECLLRMFERISIRVALLSNSRLLELLLDVDTAQLFKSVHLVASSTAIAYLVSPFVDIGNGKGHHISCGDLLRGATKELYPNLLGPVHKCFMSESFAATLPMSKVLSRIQQPLKHFKPGKALSEAYTSFLASDAAKSVPSPENSFATFLASVYSPKHPATVVQHIGIMMSFDSLMVAEISSPAARKDTMVRWLMFCESILVGFRAEDMLGKVSQLKILPAVAEFRSGLKKEEWISDLNDRRLDHPHSASAEARELHSFIRRLYWDFTTAPMSLLSAYFDQPKSVECRLVHALVTARTNAGVFSVLEDNFLAKALSSLIITGKIEAAREFCNSSDAVLKGEYQDAMKKFLMDRDLLNGPLRLYKPKKKGK